MTPTPTPISIGPPSSFLGGNETISSLRLTWAHDGTNLDHFELSRRVGNSGSYTSIAPAIASGLREYTDTGLLASTNYCYLIEASAFDGNLSSAVETCPTTADHPGDDRYGVILHTNALVDNEYFLNQLGVKWYITFDDKMSEVPAGRNKVPFIRVPVNPTVWTSGQAEAIDALTESQIAALGFSDPAVVRQTAQDNPGSFWYMWGEPNRYMLALPEGNYMSPQRFAPVFKYYYDLIKEADDTAKILGPSVLNWDFTCAPIVGPGKGLECPGTFLCENGEFFEGYTCGKAWLREFIEEYQLRYGIKPPVYAWTIDVYPIDWHNLPNNDPAKQATVTSRQVV